MMEVLFPSCSPQESRPKYPDLGLELSVYIGPDFYGTPGLIWNGEFSLAVGLPTDSRGGYTAVRIDNMGSMAGGTDWVTLTGTLELAGTNEC